MEKILSNFFIIVGFLFLYIATGFFVSGTSENKNSKFNFVENIFAGINFDSQNSDMWYNENTPQAIVSTSPVPEPMKEPISTRLSH